MVVHANEILNIAKECETGAAKFNRRLGTVITHGVATMWCAYAFAFIALISLPAVVATHSLLNLVAWIAQTFLQLVLLAIILYGQNLMNEKADSRADATYQNTADSEKVLAELAKIQDEQLAILKRLDGKVG